MPHRYPSAPISWNWLEIMEKTLQDAHVDIFAKYADLDGRVRANAQEIQKSGQSPSFLGAGQDSGSLEHILRKLAHLDVTMQELQQFVQKSGPHPDNPGGMLDSLHKHQILEKIAGLEHKLEEKCLFCAKSSTLS